MSVIIEKKALEMNDVSLQGVGAVVIGRNEGKRLVNCLNSLLGKLKAVVYVDSGSTDNSIDTAIGMGVEVVELDMSSPFTAARARNAGVKRLRELVPQITYVQFVDGDCEVVDGWLATAVNFLAKNDQYAVVCGRRRERFPSASIYNWLCDVEWARPPGEARACGGDAMMRLDAFDQVGGFRADLIAGEEPELCMRFRNTGWRIWRLPDEMVLHDADMTKFSQWWIRSVRTGHTFAEGVHRLGRDCVKERNSTLIWGLLIPVLLVAGTITLGPLALLGALVYPLHMLRMARKGNLGLLDNLVYAFFEILCKFPELLGVIRYYVKLAIGKKSTLIEYK